MFISTNETKLIKKSEANGEEGEKKEVKEGEGKERERERGEYTDDRVANDLKAVQL